MGSWGATTADESKPKYLTDAEKRDCFADNTGWTFPAGGNGNPNAQRETLVAIGDLSGATKLAAGTISAVRFISTALGAAAGGSFSAEVVYNEAVDVVTTGGTPQMTITNTPGTDVVLDYASGTGTNRLTFTATVAGGATAENDVLSIGANSIALNSGTIKDAGTAVDSEITHGAQTATITVGA